MRSQKFGPLEYDKNKFAKALIFVLYFVTIIDFVKISI